MSPLMLLVSNNTHRSKRLSINNLNASSWKLSLIMILALSFVSQALTKTHFQVQLKLNIPGDKRTIKHVFYQLETIFVVTHQEPTELYYFTGVNEFKAFDPKQPPIEMGLMIYGIYSIAHDQISVMGENKDGFMEIYTIESNINRRYSWKSLKIFEGRFNNIQVMNPVSGVMIAFENLIEKINGEIVINKGWTLYRYFYGIKKLWVVDASPKAQFCIDSPSRIYVYDQGKLIFYQVGDEESSIIPLPKNIDIEAKTIPYDYTAPGSLYPSPSILFISLDKKERKIKLNAFVIAEKALKFISELPLENFEFVRNEQYYGMMFFKYHEKGVNGKIHQFFAISPKIELTLENGIWAEEFIAKNAQNIRTTGVYMDSTYLVYDKKQIWLFAPEKSVVSCITGRRKNEGCTFCGRFPSNLEYCVFCRDSVDQVYCNSSPLPKCKSYWEYPRCFKEFHKKAFSYRIQYYTNSNYKNRSHFRMVFEDKNVFRAFEGDFRLHEISLEIKIKKNESEKDKEEEVENPCKEVKTLKKRTENTLSMFLNPTKDCFDHLKSTKAEQADFIFHIGENGKLQNIKLEPQFTKLTFSRSEILDLLKESEDLYLGSGYQDSSKAVKEASYANMMNLTARGLAHKIQLVKKIADKAIIIGYLTIPICGVAVLSITTLLSFLVNLFEKLKLFNARYGTEMRYLLYTTEEANSPKISLESYRNEEKSWLNKEGRLNYLVSKHRELLNSHSYQPLSIFSSFWNYIFMICIFFIRRFRRHLVSKFAKWREDYGNGYFYQERDAKYQRVMTKEINLDNVIEVKKIQFTHKAQIFVYGLSYVLEIACLCTLMKDFLLLAGYDVLNTKLILRYSNKYFYTRVFSLTISVIGLLVLSYELTRLFLKSVKLLPKLPKTEAQDNNPDNKSNESLFFWKKKETIFTEFFTVGLKKKKIDSILTAHLNIYFYTRLLAYDLCFLTLQFSPTLQVVIPLVLETIFLLTLIRAKTKYDLFESHFVFIKDLLQAIALVFWLFIAITASFSKEVKAIGKGKTETLKIPVPLLGEKIDFYCQYTAILLILVSLFLELVYFMNGYRKALKSVWGKYQDWKAYKKVKFELNNMRYSRKQMLGMEDSIVTDTITDSFNDDDGISVL